MDYRSKLPRVYIDTSVIGGCLDEEFQEYSLALFDAARTGRARLVVSDVTLVNLRAGYPTL